MPRVGPIASPLVHAIVLALLFLLSEKRAQTQRVEEVAKAQQKPVTITFANPYKPPPSGVSPRPKFEMQKKPPPPSSKPLSMRPVPDSVAALKTPTKTPTTKDAGKNDTRAAGGLSGGPLPRPAPGVPDPAEASAVTKADSPEDLAARLRAFQRAIEAPRPPATKSSKGGGTGAGGRTIPNMPETGFGLGMFEFEGHDYDWTDYERQIHWAILQAWYRRLLADSGVFERWAVEKRTWELDHKAGIHFTILRSGQVVNVGVESASGCFPLDDSATEALEEVVLPPLPADFGRETETVHARFIAEGPIQGMRQQLRQLQDLGWF